MMGLIAATWLYPPVILFLSMCSPPLQTCQERRKLGCVNELNRVGITQPSLCLFLTYLYIQFIARACCLHRETSEQKRVTSPGAAGGGRSTLHYSAFMWDGWYDSVPPSLDRSLSPAAAHMVDDIILYHAPRFLSEMCVSKRCLFH